MMNISLIFSGRPLGANRIGWIFFQISLFLLPSSALLSGLFLLAASFYGSFKRSISYFRDIWNWPLIMASIFMVVGSFKAYSGWLAWVGLANWLPFFWVFWACQPYLITQIARKRCLLVLLLGSVPVVITGFGQIWFGWEGPWQLLNGLIIWFVAPGGSPSGRLSGLFDYANLAGAWLAMVWPFCLAYLLQTSSNRINKSIALIFAIGVVTALILTDSRNAWGGLLLAIPFVLGSIHWPWLLPLLGSILIFIAFSVFPWIDPNLQELSRAVIPEGIWSRLSDLQYVDERTIEATRLNQWKLAINFVSQRPLLGWGAAAFSLLYPSYTGLWHGHAHNLPLELAVSHGLPVTILILSFVLALLIAPFMNVILGIGSNIKTSIEDALFDRAWWTSCLILIFLHGSDMPFFDSRLNIAGWILLAGLRCLGFSSKSLINEKI